LPGEVTRQGELHVDALGGGANQSEHSATSGHGYTPMLHYHSQLTKMEHAGDKTAKQAGF
jgi:hypothetical protein